MYESDAWTLNDGKKDITTKDIGKNLKTFLVKLNIQSTPHLL
jgi:hypothetical protein